MSSTWTRNCAAALAAAVLGGCGGDESPRPAAAKVAPASAPVGTIAYQTDRGGTEGVWLIGADAEGDHQVATDVPDEHLHPDWSPDGERLLFTKRADKDLLFEADAKGRGAEQILACDDPCIGDDEASYSPDGKRIAFIRTLGPLREDRPADCSLWVLDRASGKARRLSRNRGCVRREAFPRWSPDGRTLVYFREKSDEFGQTYATAIFTRPAKGGPEKQLTPWKLDAGDPDWSPDGERIVFSTSPFVYFDGAGTANLHTMRPDGSDRRQLTAHGEGGPRLGHPRWTPDGRHIVHVKDTGSARELWLVDADGRQPVQITAGGIFTHPVWRPQR